MGAVGNAQNWEQLSDPPIYKHHSNGFSFGGKAYVFEGVNQESTSSEVWEYTPDTDSWTQLDDFPGPARAIAIGDEWGGKYYYGFGDDSNRGGLSDLWEFDPSTGTYTELPSCPCPGRAHPAFIAFKDKIYMGAGSSDNGDLNDWWVYDMIDSSWTQKVNIPGPVRHHPFFFESGDKVYVGGGHIDNWLSYDINTDEWNTIDNLPGGRVAGTQLSYNGVGLIVGGDNERHDPIPQSETFMSFDPAIGEWKYLPVLPNKTRWAPSSFIIDDVLYYFGGISFTEFSGDISMWKFDLSYLSCLPSTNLNAINIDSTSADLFWISSNQDETDTLRWRKVGEDQWNEIADPEAVYSLTGLETCTSYEFQVIAGCGSSTSPSMVHTFETAGCGACLDLAYCTVPASMDDDHIAEVSINDYVNTSGSDGGYGSFAFSSTAEPISQGESFELSVTPAPSGGASDLFVWIDFDASGEFDTDELVLNVPGLNTTRTVQITVPQDAEVGIVRMRVMYERFFNQDPTPCVNEIDGEVEDYCLDILENVSNVEDDLLGVTRTIVPNPIGDYFRITGEKNDSKQYTLRIIDVYGKVVRETETFNLHTDTDVSNLSSGVYVVELRLGQKLVETTKVVKL